MSDVRCQVYILDNLVELVGGGSIINLASSSSLNLCMYVLDKTYMGQKDQDGYYAEFLNRPEQK